MRPLIALILPMMLHAADPAYVKEVEEFRATRETRLKADDGWLTVTGLFWLKQGQNRIGAGPNNDIVLPPKSAPEFVGIVTLKGETADFQPAPNAGVTLNGKPLSAKATLRSDAEVRPPDTLAVRRLKLLYIKRAPRYAIRLKDNDSEIRRNFTKLSWYPVKEDWRIEAKFIPQPGDAKITFETVVGNKETYESAGFAVFKRDGKEYRLEAAKEDDKLWFVFRDGTSGKTTYGGARQLYAETPRGDKVTLDFNKAYNFPCAFTPYSTCPLPPPQNRLTLPVEAGELDYKH